MGWRNAWHRWEIINKTLRRGKRWDDVGGARVDFEGRGVKRGAAILAAGLYARSRRWIQCCYGHERVGIPARIPCPARIASRRRLITISNTAWRSASLSGAPAALSIK